MWVKAMERITSPKSSAISTDTAMFRVEGPCACLLLSVSFAAFCLPAFLPSCLPLLLLCRCHFLPSLRESRFQVCAASGREGARARGSVARTRVRSRPCARHAPHDPHDCATTSVAHPFPSSLDLLNCHPVRSMQASCVLSMRHEALLLFVPYLYDHLVFFPSSAHVSFLPCVYTDAFASSWPFLLQNEVCDQLLPSIPSSV